MRVVLDTNVVVSAFLRGGKPGTLIEFAKAGRLCLFTSSPLMAELDDVIYRRKFVGMLARINLSASDILDRYALLAPAVDPHPLRRIASDPDDDVVLGTARAARADLIISGDQHLLALGSFEGIPIVSVAEALERIEAAGQERSVH